MFFEDEKDIIREGVDIHIDEDGTVTWEDVLNTDEEIPVLDDTPQDTTTKLDNELELVQSEDEEIDDQELMKILSKSGSNSSDNKQVATQVQEEKSEEDFDIDGQLANVVLEENKNNKEEDFIPRKKEKKSNNSTSPLLLAVLFACLIAFGVYQGMQFLQNNDSLKQVSKKNLPAKPSVQEDMNNLTQETLEQRQIENEENLAKEEQENIPVVNEEQANEVKPSQEEEKKEKKQVIKVVPTGRSNPFMPISKYATTTIPEATIDYDDSGIPKPPESYGEKTDETIQLMSIAVSGIMYDEVKPSAIITHDNNDYFVQKGDRLDNYKIIDISKNYVKIALGNNIYKANIGEEFKINSNFDGNAQFIPEKQGGGRQYYSVGDQNRQQTSGRQQGLRYVSEDDIKINTRY